MWHTLTIVELKEAPPQETNWTASKKHQLSLASSFALWFYVILFVIWWGRKLCISFKKYFTVVEKIHFFCITEQMIRKMTLYFEIFIFKNSLSCKINPIFRISTQKYTGKSIEQWKIISNQISPVGYPRENLMEKPLGGSTGELWLEIIFHYCIDFPVYFCVLILNMGFILHDNEFMTMKISKYNVIFLIIYGKNGFSQQQ